MYIKVENKNNNTNNNNNNSFRKKSSETKLPLKTDGLNNKYTNNNIIITSSSNKNNISNSHSIFTSPFVTPPNSNHSSFSSSSPSLSPHQNNTKEIYSLKFLHKPQRVNRFNSDRIPEEILQRNTDLNKQITLDIPPLSPKSTLPLGHENLNSIDCALNNYGVYDSYTGAFNYSNNDSSESFINQNTPVYKKSGELVKSSLKRRSKSLPSTPAAAAAIAATAVNNGKQSTLLRSKSVHFDQRAPVRYFISDESPMNVYSKDEFEDMLKCHLLSKAQNLGQIANIDDDRVRDESAGQDFLIKFKKLLLEEKRKLLQGDHHLDRESINDEKTTMVKSNDGEKPLRKSKRFQDIASKQKYGVDDHDDFVNTSSDNIPKRIGVDSIPKQKIIKIPSGTKTRVDTDISKNDDLSDNNNVKVLAMANSKQQMINKMKTNRVVGLYNQNFPILSNKNPKSLKLNIFVSLSQDKKVFLQEISLHIHQKNFMPPNFKGIGPAANTTRYIIGKVLVKNIYYDKRVTLRYTWNNWNTFNEVECLWLSNGDSVLPGTNMDVFHFLISDTNKIDTVGKLEFCICYVTRNDKERLEFWDNNDGNNYKVEVVMNGFNNPFIL